MNRLTASLIYLLGLMCLVSVQPAAMCEEGAQARITGKVTLPDGSAASGAKVEAVDPWRQYQTIGTATANELGEYVLDVPPGNYALRASRGVYVFFDLKTDGLVQAKTDTHASGPVDVTLKKGCIIHGSVIDTTTGQMVGGADIYGRRGEHTATNIDGSFQMILPKGSHTLTTVKKGYYQPMVHVEARNIDTLAIMIETKPGGTIRGKVTDEQGNPLEGVGIGHPRTFFHFQRTKTNAEGKYELEGFDTDAYTEIYASKDGYDSKSDSSVSFPSGQREMTLDFKLQKTETRTIAGRVTKPDGSPAGGARVAYGWTTCYAGYKEVRSREDGSFELAGVDTSRNVVMAHLKGFAPAFAFVEADDPAKLEMQLKPGHSLEGRFVDEDGKPVPGVHMSICVEDPVMDKMGFCGETTYRWLYQGVQTGDDGIFKLDSLPEKRIIIEAYAKDRSEISGMPLEVDRTDHVITMKSPGEIAGKVVRADTGDPVTSFKARVTFSHERRSGDVSSGLVFSLTDGMDFNSADGTFSIPGLVNGATFRVEIDAPGYRRAAVDRVLVQPMGKADASQLIFKLHPGESFGGVITDAETGKPVEDVLVTVIDGGRGAGDHFQWNYASEMKEHTKSARTDAQGSFKLDSVASQSGEIMLEKPGYGRSLVRNVDFGQQFEFKLGKGATISGVVTDASGKPESDVRISIEWLGEGRKMVSYDYLTTDAEGRFKAENIPEGRYIINQTRNSKGERMLEADIAAGENYVVDWNRPGEAVLEGVVTLEGKPVEGAHIILHPVDGWMYSGFANTGEDGKYSISIYKARDYNITISQGEWMDPNHIWIKKTAQIKPGSNKLDVEFPSASISGQVIDASGKPVQGLMVRAYHHLTEEEKTGKSGSGDWSRQHTGLMWWPENTVTTDADGKFEMKNIVGGEWLIAAVDNNKVGVHTKPFKLADKQKKTDVLIHRPEYGRAEIVVIDPATGEAMNEVFTILVDDSGFTYYTEWEEKRFVFEGIPAGSYRAVACTRGYTAASINIRVSAGGVTKAEIKPEPGPKIVFRLKETVDNAMPGLPWLGYTITKAGTNQPVLEDYRGSVLGDVTFFGGDHPREAIIAVKAGKYDLKAGLRMERSSGVLSANEDLWSYENTVEVKAGEDLVIEVPWR